MITTSFPSGKTIVPLFFKAYRELVRVDVQLRRRGFSAVHEAIKNLRPVENAGSEVCGEICRAVELACVFYLREVQCLQRSAATVRLLRKYGAAAELVIGIQQWPFRAHAWVELAGQVVNDKAHVTQGFVVIERC